jgi:FkbM family methyltransferase
MRTALGRRGMQLRRQCGPLAVEPELELQPTLELLAAQVMIDHGPELFVLQIGAYDGISNDPVHDLIVRHGWRGVLLEPQLRYFERLQETYRGREGISLVNAAIAPQPGRRTLYWAEEDPRDETPDIGQFASFDPEHVARQAERFPGLRERMRSTEIECVTFEMLLEGVERVDVLQIDTEGFDAEVVEMFDLARWRPRIVQFEHLHLDRAVHDATVERLCANGYKAWRGRLDTLAYRE